MMKFFFAALSSSFIFAFADVVSDDCIIIRNENYEKQVLKTNIENPYQLAIDHNRNILFYSYTAQGTEEMFKSAYLDLRTGAFGTVNGIKGGFANAVNSNNNIVYMGGEDGLYKFDYHTMSATRLNLKENVNIWQMFYKDGLYFTTFPEEQVYCLKNYQVEKVQELANIRTMLISADKENNLVYFNSSGVFMYERGTGSTIFMSDAVANGVTSDRDGNIVFSTPNGIYTVKMKAVHHVAYVSNMIYGIALENNGNLIFGTEKSIIRLKLTARSCISRKSTTPRIFEIDIE